jgi:hypothetical protein
MREIKFHVIDKNTSKEADIEQIAIKEDWAKGLIYCDMEGFFINEEGDLILADECGNYVFCDQDRFQVVWEKKP